MLVNKEIFWRFFGDDVIWKPLCNAIFWGRGGIWDKYPPVRNYVEAHRPDIIDKAINENRIDSWYRIWKVLTNKIIVSRFGRINISKGHLFSRKFDKLPDKITSFKDGGDTPSVFRNKSSLLTNDD